MNHSTPDFDGQPLKLVEDAYSLSKQFQSPRNIQYSRDYKLYSSFIDMTGRNPDRANIFIPKIRSIVETKTAAEARALLSTSPFIPFTARRKEFAEQAEIMTDVLDGYLLKADFYQKAVSALRSKICYGTSFMEAVPYYTMIKQKAIVPDLIYGLQVGMKVEEFEVPRLRLKVRDWCPWEIYVDPYATGLEERGSCRFVIKMQLASRKQIIELAQQGAYPGLDIDKLEQDGTGSETGDHKGLEILSEIGLSNLSGGDDQGIVMRYESDDRYIDIWNNRIVLRDIENPFAHGTINLTRFIHSQDVHTQNKFWGLGEAKSNQVLQSMLNDTWNMTFNSHEMIGQPMIFYKKDAVSPDALVRTSGNRVAVDIESGRPITDAILETSGQQLPGDHYMIPQHIERMMDLGSGNFAPNRGEEGKRKTLGEAAMLKETGDLGGELSVKLGEKIFLADFGAKCLSHIDQFAANDDLVEEVGLEKAAILASVNPQDLPGGFNFEFKGSDRVANAMIKQRNLRELVPFLLQIPNIHQGKLAELMLDMHDLDIDKAELIIPDEMLMQLQMLAAQAEQELIAQAGQVKPLAKSAPKQPFGGSTPNNLKRKSKVNTTAQVAADAGKVSTRGAIR